MQVDDTLLECDMVSMYVVLDNGQVARFTIKKAHSIDSSKDTENGNDNNSDDSSKEESKYGNSNDGKLVDKDIRFISKTRQESESPRL